VFKLPQKIVICDPATGEKQTVTAYLVDNGDQEEGEEDEDDTDNEEERVEVEVVEEPIGRKKNYLDVVMRKRRVVYSDDDEEEEVREVVQGARKDKGKTKSKEETGDLNQNNGRGHEQTRKQDV
jgi:hypothetical protein